MQILCIPIDFLNIPRICFEGNDKYNYEGLRGPASGTFCKYQLKHKFYVHVVVHSCEILWNIVKYNCNERKICVSAVQSEIMLKSVTGPQRTRNALIRGIWGNALWGLRMFIKNNSHGQFIALLSNEHHGYIKHCCLWISLISVVCSTNNYTTIIWYHICAVCNVHAVCVYYTYW